MKIEPPRLRYYRVQWPTREPRPRLRVDKQPSMIEMLRKLLRPRRG